MPGSAAPAGPVVRQADPLGHQSRNQSARGAQNKKAAPSGAGRKACGTERVISPAPLHGALRGVPAEGVAGDSKAAPAQGKAFPSELNSVYLWTIHRPKNRPKTDFRPVRPSRISKSTRYSGA